MLAREAPVSCLFSSDNRNVLTFAVSDALNTISTGSGVREEDALPVAHGASSFSATALQSSISRSSSSGSGGFVMC